MALAALKIDSNEPIRIGGGFNCNLFVVLEYYDVNLWLPIWMAQTVELWFYLGNIPIADSNQLYIEMVGW